MVAITDRITSMGRHISVPDGGSQDASLVSYDYSEVSNPEMREYLEGYDAIAIGGRTAPRLYQDAFAQCFAYAQGRYLGVVDYPFVKLKEYVVAHKVVSLERDEQQLTIQPNSERLLAASVYGLIDQLGKVKNKDSKKFVPILQSLTNTRDMLGTHPLANALYLGKRRVLGSLLEKKEIATYQSPEITAKEQEVVQKQFSDVSNPQLAANLIAIGVEIPHIIAHTNGHMRDVIPIIGKRMGLSIKTIEGMFIFANTKAQRSNIGVHTTLVMHPNTNEGYSLAVTIDAANAIRLVPYMYFLENDKKVRGGIWKWYDLKKDVKEGLGNLCHKQLYPEIKNEETSDEKNPEFQSPFETEAKVERSISGIVRRLPENNDGLIIDKLGTIPRLNAAELEGAASVGLLDLIAAKTLITDSPTYLYQMNFLEWVNRCAAIDPNTSTMILYVGQMYMEGGNLSKFEFDETDKKLFLKCLLISIYGLTHLMKKDPEKNSVAHLFSSVVKSALERWGQEGEKTISG